MRLLSWNVNSLRVRLAQTLRYVDETSPDVVCLQETRVSDGAFPRTAFEERGFSVVAHGSGGRNGVALLSRSGFGNVVRGLPSSANAEEGRRIAAVIDGVFLDTVYVPTRRAIGKVEFLSELREEYHREGVTAGRAILCGDFNVCFDLRDLKSTSMITDAELFPRRPEDLAFRRLLDVGLEDCFRRHVESGEHYTWFPHAAWAVRRNYGMRLDYVFASPEQASRCRAIRHDLAPRKWDKPSDHLPLLVDFDA